MGPSAPRHFPAQPAPQRVELENESDDALLALARDGMTPAFDTLIRRHRDRVLRLAARYVGDAALAKDIAQNTFVALFRALPGYRAEGKFSSFLYRLLLNQCRMARRSERAEVKALDAVSRLGNPEPLVGASAASPRDVENALASLSDKLRDAVVLRFAGDLSYQEIAETLEIPVGTAKRRVFEAMAKLRHELEES